MLHDQFRAERIFSRWSVRPSYGESATTYFASLVADSEDCTPKTFAQQNDLLSGTNPSLRILEALSRLPLTNDEKASLIRWTPMRIPHLQGWELCGHLIAAKRFSEIGRHCSECIREAAFHRVWWDIQGFVTCPIHDIAMTKVRNRRLDNDYLRFTFHGVAQRNITSPPILSDRGRYTYEGHLLQSLGAVEPAIPRPILEDQPLDAQIKAIQMVGRFLSSPKTLNRTPPMRQTSMAVGFDALGHDANHLEDRFSTWLIANHSPEQLRHVTLDNFGYLGQIMNFDGPLKDRVVAAKLNASARHGTLTPVLRMKPGVDVPLHMGGLASETALTRYGLEVLLRLHWKDMPGNVVEVPRDVAEQVRVTARELVPLETAARRLGCSQACARSVARVFSVDKQIVSVALKVGKKARLHFIRSHLDWMSDVLDNVQPVPVGVRTVGISTFAKHRHLGEHRVMVDVLSGRQEAFRGSSRNLDKLQFARPAKLGWGGKPAPIGRTHVPQGAMLACEFHGISGANATAAVELVRQGFIAKYGDKRGLLDRGSVLAFHERYVNPVRYLMGRGMVAIDAIWALKKMDLPLAFQHRTIRPYFAERKELEAKIGPLYRPTKKMMERWRALIRHGADNCPSFIIPEVPGDGTTYVYTSSRTISFRVIFEMDALRLIARFTPEARRIWNVYVANAEVFRVLLESFRWQADGNEITASCQISTDSEIEKATVELGKLSINAVR